MTPVPMPRIEEVRAAAQRLRGIAVRTPLVPLHAGGRADTRILLKPEILQPTGSFKIRGVFNAVARLSDEKRRAGLCTVSAGNTAQALAWCGRHFGVPARSVMPETAPKGKIDAMRALGGEPVLMPRAEVFRYLKEHLWLHEPYAFIHPWIDPDLIAGHGTMGAEIAAECPGVETVFIPVGGGGLMGGVGSALRALVPSVRIVAVEPEGCPSLHASLEAGKPMTVECSTICDGVAVPYITQEMYPLLAQLTDESVIVHDEETKRCVRLLATGGKMVAEPSGALALAAAIAMDPARRGLSVCLVTGGNIDPDKLAGILA